MNRILSVKAVLFVLFLILGADFLWPVGGHAEETPQKSSTPKALSPNALPIEITADRLEYFKDEDRYRAEGSVKITQGEVVLTADQITLDNKTGQACAKGDVSLRDGGDLLTSEALEFNFREKTGAAVPGRLLIRDEHLDLRAARLFRKSELRYELYDWWVTGCRSDAGKSPLWHLRGRSAKVELGGYLVARNVTFYIKNIPVFYTPFLFFPVKTERQSGLLVPRVGYSTKDGFRYNHALFLALTPSQDATLTLDTRSIRGIGGGLQYRYKISRGSEGQLSYSIFDDRITESLRSETQYKHVQTFSRDFIARLNVHLVSDINQFKDLNDSTASRVQQSIGSSFVLFRRWDNQEVYLLARMTKNLRVETDTTLQRLPELGYRLIDYQIGDLPVYAGLESTAIYFWRDVEDEAAGLVTATRLDAFPNLSARLNLAGIEIVPRVGYRETWYSRRVDSEEATSRGVEIFQVRAKTRLSRMFHSSENTRLDHHIQPSVDYDYVPAVDQDRLPHFDALDQLPRKNRVTYSLTNRLVFRRSLVDSETDSKAVRRELVFWKITQSYDLHARRIREDPGVSRPFSNIRSESVLRPTGKLTVDLDVFYNLSRDETVSFNSDISYALFSFWRISAGQRYTRLNAGFPRGNIINALDPDEEAFWFSKNAPLIRFLSGSTQLNFPFGLTVTTTAYYDAETREFGDILYGLVYNGLCWGFTASYQDLPDKNQFTFMVTLRPPRLTGMAQKFSR